MTLDIPLGPWDDVYHDPQSWLMVMGWFINHWMFHVKQFAKIMINESLMVLVHP